MDLLESSFDYECLGGRIGFFRERERGGERGSEREGESERDGVRAPMTTNA